MKNLKLWSQHYLVVGMGRPGALNQVASQLAFLQLSPEAEKLNCSPPLRYTMLLGHPEQKILFFIFGQIIWILFHKN